MTILVTGGCGYIGSHACRRLLQDGYRVVILDDLSRGHRDVVDTLRTLPAVRPEQLRFVHGNIGDEERTTSLLHKESVEAVMHFAALSLVGESMRQPLLYYENNVGAATRLLSACKSAGVAKFVFSSTAATYGIPESSQIPITEECPQRPINPYGASKSFFERVLRDHARHQRDAGQPFGYAILRYFNVAGCSDDALLGERHEPETHLIPIVLEVAEGRRESVTVYGTDYGTRDGTCVRDYVHVNDLIDAHIDAMQALRPGTEHTYNLGLGRGYSVREIIDSARKVTGHSIPVEEGDKRPGDPPVLCTDPKRARDELGWKPRYTEPEQIIETAWRWATSRR